MNKQSNKILNVLSFFISSILSPYVVAAVFAVIIIYSYSASFKQFFPWMLTFSLFGLIIPGGYVLWLIESKRVHDIHIDNPKERRFPFLLAAVSAAIGTLVLWVLGASWQVFLISLVYSVNTILIAIITQYWKVSVHMAMFSSVATMAVILFGRNLWWLFLILVPLAWSRIYRHKHTLLQTIVGFLMASIITAVIFGLFGYSMAD